jgi:RHS repeat-associated protein
VYYYTRDHLGSIRELTDATGAVRAEYDYDPWGRRTKLSGDLDADFGFTGDFEHASGLKLTWFREYNPDLGRWLTRDPLGIRGGGVNLYAYVDDSPVDWRDPLGLCGNNYGNGGAAGGPGGSWGGSNDNASQNASTMLPSSGGITAQAGGLAGVAPLGGEYAGIAGFAGYFLNSGWGIAMPQPTAGDTGRATTGAYAGAGGGLFISSATTPDQLEAMDNQLSLGAGLLFDGVTVTIAWGPNGWYIAVYPLGPGGGAYISYTTGCDSNR